MFNRVNLSWGLDNKVVNLNQATTRKTFFLIKLFLAFLYKESISNDFQGLWCLDEVFSAKLCWFQNLFVFLQQVSPRCR